MELSEFELCPKCSAIMKTDYCLNCGYNIDGVLKEKVDDSTTKKEVKSIFDQLISPEYDLLINNEDPNASDLIDSAGKSKKKYIFLSLWVLMFALFIGYFLFSLFFSKLNYVRPGEILKKSQEVNVDELIAKMKPTSSVGLEKVIELETNLKEGNFEKLNFAVFASPDTNLMIEMFDFGYFLKEVTDQDDLYSKIKADFDVSDDDLEVYIDKSFALIFPDNDFEKWGIALNVKDEKFATRILESYKKFVQDSKSLYSEYSIEIKKVEDNSFILISNSKVYLDQMKESSEGNLPNLGADGLYVGVMQDLPKLGVLSVYKKAETRSWTYLSEWAKKLYPELLDLDQVMGQITSRGILIYSKDRTTRIVTSKE